MMKCRIIYLALTYLAFVAVFVLQKPLFMLAAMPDEVSCGVADVCCVMCNGLLLDIPVAGYLICLPLLFIIVSLWIPRVIRLRRWLTPYYMLVATVVAIIFVADATLYPFWHFKMDATVFYYLDSPKNATASVSSGFLAVRVLLIVAYAALLLCLMRLVTPKCLRPLMTLRHKAIATFFLVLLILPLAISIRGGVRESTANIGKVYFSEREFLNHSAVNPCFSLLASVGKTDDYASMFDFYDENERREIVATLYPATPTDTLSLLRTPRPNVLIILLESFGGIVVEAAGGRPDVAPNYNRLAAEGIHFTNCFSNSFRTDRGVVSALSGYPSFPTLSVMKIPAKSRTLPCIARTLNAQGYASSFLYGGDINFTNMQSYLRTGGYASITKDDDFSREEQQGSQWGVNDHVAFGRLLSMIDSQQTHPWHITFLTLSSHEPFEVPYSKFDDKVYNAFAYTDDCLGRFIDSFRQTTEWDNTLIVCLPDHGFRYPSTISRERYHHSTMFWTGGAVRRPMLISRLMNQSDMAATLLGQLGIDHSDYIFSRDVMSEEYSNPFAFISFTGGMGVIDSTGCTVYDLTADRITENRDAAMNAADTDSERNTSADYGLQDINNDSFSDARVRRGKAIVQTLYDDLGAR